MTMKLYAKTNHTSYLNNFSGEPWQVVRECYNYYPSGCRKCVQFQDGFVCKIEECDIVYVFEAK